jgi:hypothetical protein
MTARTGTTAKMTAMRTYPLLKKGKRTKPTNMRGIRMSTTLPVLLRRKMRGSCGDARRRTNGWRAGVALQETPPLLTSRETARMVREGIFRGMGILGLGICSTKLLQHIDSYTYGDQQQDGAEEGKQLAQFQSSTCVSNPTATATPGRTQRYRRKNATYVLRAEWRHQTEPTVEGGGRSLPQCSEVTDGRSGLVGQLWRHSCCHEAQLLG